MIPPLFIFLLVLQNPCANPRSRPVSTATMRSLILIMTLLSTLLASPVLRSRLVQDVDAYGTLDNAKTNPVDPEVNIFDNNNDDELTNLASGWTGSVGTSTTLDRQGYPASTDLETANVIATPINFGDNIHLGAPGQQDGLIAAVDRTKPGLQSTPTNPCPNIHTLCSHTYQYFTPIKIIDAYPCSFLSNF